MSISSKTSARRPVGSSLEVSARVLEHLEQADYVRVRGQAFERLDLAEVGDLGGERGACLFERIEVVLHALDGHKLARLDGLGLQHFGEGALALLGNQSVLCAQPRSSLCMLASLKRDVTL